MLLAMLFTSYVTDIGLSCPLPSLSAVIIDTRGTGELQAQSTAFALVNMAVQSKVPGGTIQNTLSLYEAGVMQMSAGGTIDVSYIVQGIGLLFETLIGRQ